MKAVAKSITIIILGMALGATFSGCIFQHEQPGPFRNPQPFSVAPKVDTATLNAALAKLKTEDESEKEKAIYAIAKMGTGAKDAEPELMKVYDSDKSTTIRLAVLRTIACIDHGSKTTNDLIISILSGDDPILKAEVLRFMTYKFTMFTAMVPGPNLAIDFRDEGFDANGEANNTDQKEKIHSLVVDALGDQDKDVRFHAAWYLYENWFIGKFQFVNREDAALPVIIEALDDNSTWRWSIAAVSNYGSDAKAAEPKLLEILESAPPEPSMNDILKVVNSGQDMREWLQKEWPGSSALAEIEKFSPDGIEYPKQHNQSPMMVWNNGWSESLYYHLNMVQPRYAVIDALGNISSDAAVINALKEVSNGKDKDIAFVSLLALGKMGIGGDGYIKKVIDMYASLPGQVLSYKDVVTVIKNIADKDPSAEDAVPGILELTHNHNATIRGFGYDFLAALGPRAKDALPEMEKILKSYKPVPESDTTKEEPWEPYSAGYVIVCIEAPPGKEHEYYVEKLHDGNMLIRQGAVRALQELGEESFYDIATALGDPSSEVSRFANNSLTEILKATNEKVKYMRWALNSTDYYIRAFAAQKLNGGDRSADTIIQFGLDVDETVRRIADILETTDWTQEHALEPGAANDQNLTSVFIQNCIQILKGTDQPADVIIPGLIAAIGHGEPDAQSRVINLLAEYGPDAAPAVPKLAELITTARGPHVKFAIYALGQIGPAAVDAVPALIPLLQNQYPGIRATTAEALGNIGPGAKAAISALQKTADSDDNGDVRKAAQDAITKIEGK